MPAAEGDEAQASPAAAPEAQAVPALDPAALQRRLQLTDARLREVLAAYKKLKIENEGFRERITRDVQRQFERHGEKLLLKFIDVLDNLDRALGAAEQSSAGNPLIEGLILVRTQLLQLLQKEGLERIPVLGLPFDPNFSEAVGTQAVADPDHDKVVVRELQRGYRLHGKVARASRVMVGIFSEGAREADSDGDLLIGADETPPGGTSLGEADPAAETLRIDEGTLRAIFGNPDEPESE
jgi:molecular chaperone GrpE